MIITTLNIEKKEELEQLEQSYKNQLMFYEENQRTLENTIEEMKEKMRKLQVRLDLEVQKKEELEDELMQKGSGHEEEVSTRIQFESKVNQMYAKQRDMEAKTVTLQEVIDDLQRTLDLKSQQLFKDKKTMEDLLSGKEKLDNENKRLEDRFRQLDLVKQNLEQRLNESYSRNDELNENFSRVSALNIEAQNSLTQRKIEIEDKKMEIQVKQATLAKLEKLIEELKQEKITFLKRIIELESIITEEHDKNNIFKQEYARIRESDNFYAVEYMKSKEKCEDLERKLEELQDDKTKLKIHLESTVQGYEEYKIQLKKAQERIEDMNKGRRSIEEMNEILHSRLAERTEEVKDLRSLNLELKDDIEKAKTRESGLENEITTLTIKLKSVEKQYEANKETMQQKINSLSDIISSEKKIRESWILKFEEEQKNLSMANRMLVASQDQQNELSMKLNSSVLANEEKAQKLKMLGGKNNDLLEELMELKATQEELIRKNKTFQMLYENSEKERIILIKNHAAEMEYFREVQQENNENFKASMEDLHMAAANNWTLYLEKCEKFHELFENFTKLMELQKLTSERLEKSQEYNSRVMMFIEELEPFAIATETNLEITTERLDLLEQEHNSLIKEHSHFLSLIPEELKDEEDPFQVLTGKINDLSETLKEIEYFKSHMIDFEVQYDYFVPVFDENTQTDIGFSFFEKRRMSSSGTPHSGSQRVYSAKSREGPAVIEEYPKKKNPKIPPQSSESALREESPFNMTSVYNQSFNNLKNLPAIKTVQSSLKPLPPAPADIKRLIKTANSRRKNDTNFL
jgi:chromosome segregation ATPase